MRLRAGLCLLACASCIRPEWGANAVLHPYRKPLAAVPDLPYDEVGFTGEGGIALRGWRFRASGERRGLLVEAALAGPKRLLLVPGAGHDDTLRGKEVWAEIEGWLAALDLER